MGGWLDGRVGGFFFINRGLSFACSVCAKCLFFDTAIVLVAGNCFHVLCIGKVNNAILFFVCCEIELPHVLKNVCCSAQSDI